MYTLLTVIEDIITSRSIGFSAPSPNRDRRLPVGTQRKMPSSTEAYAELIHHTVPEPGQWTCQSIRFQSLRDMAKRRCRKICAVNRPFQEPCQHPSIRFPAETLICASHSSYQAILRKRLIHKLPHPFHHPSRRKYLSLARRVIRTLPGRFHNPRHAHHSRFRMR